MSHHLLVSLLTEFYFVATAAFKASQTQSQQCLVGLEAHHVKEHYAQVNYILLHTCRSQRSRLFERVLCLCFIACKKTKLLPWLIKYW